MPFVKWRAMLIWWIGSNHNRNQNERQGLRERYQGSGDWQHKLWLSALMMCHRWITSDVYIIWGGRKAVPGRHYLSGWISHMRCDAWYFPESKSIPTKDLIRVRLLKARGGARSHCILSSFQYCELSAHRACPVSRVAFEESGVPKTSRVWVVATAEVNLFVSTAHTSWVHAAF